MFIKQVMARPVPAHPKWKYIRGEKRSVSICDRLENA